MELLWNIVVAFGPMVVLGYLFVKIRDRIPIKQWGFRAAMDPVSAIILIGGTFAAAIFISSRWSVQFVAITDIRWTLLLNVVMALFGIGIADYLPPKEPSWRKQLDGR